MVLTTSDFAAATTYLDQHLAPTYPFVSTYERGFVRVRVGGTKVSVVVTIVNLLPDESTATLGFDQFRSALSTPSIRKPFAKKLAGAFVQGTGGRVRVKSTAVGAPSSIAAGQAAFWLPVVFKTSVGRLESPITVFRVDRAVGIDVLLGYPRGHVQASIVGLVTRLSSAHFQTAFTVKDTVQPTISGAAQQGQTLTANPGVWSGAPSSFTYQWNRCTSAGTSCTAVAGATAPTYLVGTADSGSTIQVSVTGANTVSSSSATSAATALVP